MTEILFIGYTPIIIESSEEGFERFIDRIDKVDKIWWRMACLGFDPRRDGAIWFDPPG